MKARLYSGTTLVGEAEIRDVRLGIGQSLTVVLVDVHPRPESRPLFLSGRLETAQPAIPAR